MKSLKNYLYQFSYQLLNLIVPLVTLPYITKRLGAENYGIYVYTFTIISYLILFTDFGLRVYGSRKISYERDNLIKKTNCFWNIFFTKFFLSLVIFFLAICIFLYKNMPLIYWLQLLSVIISILDISWFYQGIEKFKEIALRNLIIKIIFIILIFVFIKNSTDLNFYVIIVLLTNFVGNLIFYISLKNEIMKPQFKEIKIFKTMKESMDLFVPEIAIKLYTSMDRIMLGYFLLKEDVSYYDIANKFLIIVMIGITTFGSIMLPKIANLFQKNEQNEIKKILKNTIDYFMMLSIPLIFGILGTSQDLVSKFLGKDYLEVVPVINLMSFTIIFWTLNNITGSQILIPTMKEKILTKSVFIGAILNLVLNLILIKKIGLLGVVIATFLTEGVVSGIQIYYSKEYLKFDFKKILKYVLSSLIMFFLIIKIQGLFIKIFIGISVYLTLMVILKELSLKKIKVLVLG